MNIQDILQQENVHIIDVREVYEYETGNIEGSINMPLSQFGDYIEELKEMKGHKVIYCRSGGRSGQAVQYLSSIGVAQVYNGGGLGMMETYMIGC